MSEKWFSNDICLRKHCNEPATHSWLFHGYCKKHYQEVYEFTLFSIEDCKTETSFEKILYHVEELGKKVIQIIWDIYNNVRFKRWLKKKKRMSKIVENSDAI